MKAKLAGKSVDLVKHEGLYVRKDFGPDLSVFKEWSPTYRRMQHEIAGHKVLDIGANIGLFTVRAMELGATGAACYEPEAGAFSVLVANTAKFKSVTLNNAAVEVRDGSVVLYTPASGNSISATTRWPIRGRDGVTVPCVAFHRTWEECSLIKLDCEGAELSFLNGKRLPSSVRVVCGELHREHGEENTCKKIIESFSGWREIHPPASYSFARCWTVAWARRESRP